jgi:hypothetical protein
MHKTHAAGLVAQKAPDESGADFLFWCWFNNKSLMTFKNQAA